MNVSTVSKADLFSILPSETIALDLGALRERIGLLNRKVVAIDDDPTGTQTVHGIPVLTEWSVEALRREVESPYPGFYVMTNSRAMPANEASRINREIGENLRQAAGDTSIAVASRSDSTLRGHFPVETEALQAGLGRRFDVTFVAPAFFEGGRFTVGDVHYVQEGDDLVPAGLTEFASDATFGYKHSHLKSWVEEKTAGEVRASEVFSLSLETLRQKSSEETAELLVGFPKGSVCVVNAADYSDFDRFVAALLDAESRGSRFLFRCAGSLVRSLAGIEPQELLDPQQLATQAIMGGLVVVGSYIKKSTRQLQRLLEVDGVCPVEVVVDDLLDSAKRDQVVSSAVSSMNDALAAGRDAVVFTSRDLVNAKGRAGDLDVGKSVSDALVEIVRGLQQQPRFMIAKGGITSSETATKGFGVKRAMVLGQLLPGVPVWELGEETRFPGMAYVVFPGNVGSDNAIAEAVRSFR